MKNIKRLMIIVYTNRYCNQSANHCRVLKLLEYQESILGKAYIRSGLNRNNRQILPNPKYTHRHNDRKAGANLLKLQLLPIYATLAKSLETEKLCDMPSCGNCFVKSTIEFVTRSDGRDFRSLQRFPVYSRNACPTWPAAPVNKICVAIVVPYTQIPNECCNRLDFPRPIAARMEHCTAKGVAKDLDGRNFKFYILLWREHDRSIVAHANASNFDDAACDLVTKTIRLFGRDFERFGALHEYYQPENGEPILNRGFQNWNYLVLNMIAWLENTQAVEEF